MKVISRADWGTRWPDLRGDPVDLPWSEVVIHTEAGAALAATATGEVERSRVRAIERYHVEAKGWRGIAYSFLVAPSGRVYEGRGWGRSGAHTETRNRTAAGVCFLGHGDRWPATDLAWAAASDLILDGMRRGHLTRTPKITGHRDYSTKGKTCPGTLIYPELHRLRGLTITESFTMSQYADLVARLDRIEKARQRDTADLRARIAAVGKGVTVAVAEGRDQTAELLQELEELDRQLATDEGG